MKIFGTWFDLPLKYIKILKRKAAIDAAIHLRNEQACYHSKRRSDCLYYRQLHCKCREIVQ